MRVLIRFTIPVGPGNRAIADGRIGPLLGRLHETLRPEASYYMTLGGERTGMLFCDLPHVSEIPVIAEQLFMGLEAKVDFVPAMSIEDLQAGLMKTSDRK